MRAVHIRLTEHVRIIRIDRSALCVVKRVGDRAVGVRRLTLLPCGPTGAGPEGRYLTLRVKGVVQRVQL
jgi:hypothetical protein